MPEITTEWQHFETLMAGEPRELLRFRQSIFVAEQRSPYPDLDGLDESAWHFVARIDEELAGYLRVIPMTGPPPLVRIGRVAVSPSLRRCGIGRMLMEKALAFCRERFPLQPMALGASSLYYPSSREGKDMVDDTNLHQFMGQLF